MFQKINVLLGQVGVILSQVFTVAVCACGILIASDLVLPTKFGVLSDLAKMTRFSVQQITVVLLAVYLYKKK